jgi:hypothetical protein
MRISLNSSIAHSSRRLKEKPRIQEAMAEVEEEQLNDTGFPDLVSSNQKLIKRC